MFGIFRSKPTEDTPPLYLRNTLTGEKELFTPVRAGKAGIYSCGPTVYDHSHIGNLRAFILPDILRRTLEYGGYTVTQIINITDFGHLTSDADAGEDKMTMALEREGLPRTLEAMIELGERYASALKDDLEQLNMRRPQHFPKASGHILEQVSFIKTLEEKGYAYELEDGVYFDTEKFDRYGAFPGTGKTGEPEASRLTEQAKKHNPRDFALWKKDPDFGWESPWGRGFPGWHIECSAMATKYLGKHFDIHTGGMDLIAIHHNNEIAQSEAATGKPFVNYWLHNAFVTVDGHKISKSLGNTITLKQIKDSGYSPLSYRYWLLSGHYRSQMNFTWEALDASQTALSRLHKHLVEDLRSSKRGNVIDGYRRRFLSAINNDLDTPSALALLWELMKDTSVDDADKRATFLDFDRVLGIGLTEAAKRKASLLAGKEKRLSIKDAPAEVRGLVEKREAARAEHDFAEADRIREEIAERGFRIDDTNDGPVLTQTGTEAGTADKTL